MSAVFRNKDDKPKKQIKRRSKAANPRLQTEVVKLVHEEVTSAAAVRKSLTETFRPEAIPSDNTLRDMVREVLELDKTEPWTLSGAKLEDIPLILPSWLVAREHGHIMTQAQSIWILRIRAAAPDVPAAHALLLAGFCVSLPESLSWIEPLVAFAPHRDASHAERYFKAVNAGYLPAPVLPELALEGLQEREEPIGPEAYTFIQNASFPDQFLVTDDGEIGETIVESGEERRSHIIKALREKNSPK